jgi:hypothetical protein
MHETISCCGIFHLYHISALKVSDFGTFWILDFQSRNAQTVLLLTSVRGFFVCGETYDNSPFPPEHMDDQQETVWMEREASH